MNLLLLPLLLFFQGDDCRACQPLADLASALSEGNDVRFMSFIDKTTPGYQNLQTNVSALTAQSDIAASLDVVTESGDDEKLDAVVDWFMEMTSKDGTEHVSRRRQRVKVTEQKINGHWRVTAIDPIAIVAPVQVR